MNNRPANPPRSILALDFGLRRIGIATGACVTGTASALATIAAQDGRPDWESLDELVKEWSPDLLVVGLPYTKLGDESEMTAAAREFAAVLESRYQLPVDLIDERFTSVEAESLLKEQRRQGVRTKRIQKSDIDSLAAQLIAESWMQTNKKNTR